MPRYLDPKNDLPFKRIFGEHPDLLMSFLNALMPLEQDQMIESLEYLPAEQVPENPLKKNSIVDVRCKDNTGRQFIVEMQMLWNSSFSNRMLFNTSKAYVRQLDNREDYYLLQPVYGLAIINDVFDNKTGEFYHHYRVVNDKNTDEIIKGLEIVMVELPKFRPEKWADRRVAVLWLRFLKEVHGELPAPPAELSSDEHIRRALDICEEGAFTNAELDTYEQYWDLIRVENALISEYTEKGRAEGREEGRVEGRTEGAAESLARVLVNGKRSGLSLEQLRTITGLDEGQIQGILRVRGES
jgi:predicted transposase/invertase (TIGR01784 family)